MTDSVKHQWPKLFVTLSSNEPAKNSLTEVLEEGVDAIRIPFQISRQKEIYRMISDIQKFNSSEQVMTEVLLDIEGPKYRLSLIREDPNVPIIFEPDKVYTLAATDSPLEDVQLSVFNSSFFDICEVGDTVVIGDNDVIFEVQEKTGNRIMLRALTFAMLYGVSRGIFVRNKHSHLEHRDSELLHQVCEFISENPCDWLAISFVQNARDLVQIREEISSHTEQKTKIMAKIESPKGLRNASQICDVSEGLTIARGDLSAYCHYSRLAVIQRELLDICRKTATLSVVSTGMLHSLFTRPLPRPCEVTDISNIVWDGADGIQICEEISASIRPVEVIQIVKEIISSACRY